MNIIWLEGSYFKRRLALLKILENFKNCDRFVCNGDCSFEYFLTQINTGDCFEENKLIVINDLPEFKNNKQTFNKKIKTVLSELPENVFVIFNGISSVKEKAIFSHIEKIGKVQKFQESLTSKEAPSWLKEKMADKKLEADFAVCSAIIELCGYDSSLGSIGADMLEIASERIRLYKSSSKNKIVTIEDVEACAFYHENFIIWDILNAIDDKNYEKCVKLTSKISLLDSDIYSAIIQMISVLMWRFRMLIFLKDNIFVHKDQNKAVSDISKLKKMKPIHSNNSRSMVIETYASGDNQGLPQPAWNGQPIQMAVNGFYGKSPILESYTRRDIYRILRAIEFANFHIKNCSSENKLLLLVDIIFMTACNVVDNKELKVLMDSYNE